VKRVRTLGTDKPNPAKFRNVEKPRGAGDAVQGRLQPGRGSCHGARGHKWPLRGEPSKKTEY